MVAVADAGEEACEEPEPEEEAAEVAVADAVVVACEEPDADPDADPEPVAEPETAGAVEVELDS